MASASVTFDGTRVDDADSSTGWTNFPSGGPAPGAEPQLKYQGVNAVNKKITSTTNRTGLAYDPGSGALDMTAASNSLWFVKVNIADFGDLNATWGVGAAIGSDISNYHEYNIAGTGANRDIFKTYPNQGGYLIFALNPNVSSWRESPTGTPDLTAVDFYGVQAQFVAGGAKSENLAMDAVDIGTGLRIVGGDGADTDGVFQDFLDSDQGASANRWGVVTSKAGIINSVGKLKIGSNSTATEFTDDGSSIIVFPDGYVGNGDLGILCDITNVGTTIQLKSSQLISRGSDVTVDTRADFVVSGTSGAFSINGTQINNHRNVTFTSVCDITDADIECALLTQSGADISNTTIRTSASTSVACLKDPSFGSASLLHDVDFVQAGAGHAIEIAASGDYELVNLTYTGYGADSTDSAVLDITSGSGTYNLSITGGDTPTYKTAGATVNLIQNQVPLTLQVRDIVSGSAINDARCLAYVSDGANYPYQESISITRSGTTASVTHTAHGLSTNDKVYIRGANEWQYNGVKQITYISADEYSYSVSGTPATPATGTIDATLAILEEVTVSGSATESRAYPNANQPFTGWVRKSSPGSTLYKTAPISGTIDKDAGLELTVQLIPDE